ncbi:dynamin family protein [Actinoplanes teichomyceticus]|uniref:Dynamin family protein n=1 Tax=Actinoplanes teichomyceticus TaxID=1867 RepID=A0A561VMD0_ACTTI|nr:dynamin family protein [Actinoplanes teichomyceticus]TWG12776.1 dynamin family protein [Actinoplanes teichomyceticus]GIF13510.1 dynamin [Actinoplanes teichomyceticus]
MRELTTVMDTAIRDTLAYLRTTDMDAAADLAQLRHTQLTRPGVVVVGETKRGKSSLVNALLGAPGLSPVGAGVTTATYLHITPGPTYTAHAWLSDGGAPVPADDLTAFTAARRRARRIDITHPAPLLQYLSLLDTPGAGGLDPAHATVALDAVRRATALLFVADASAPLSQPELDFLARAAERIDAVIFTLTKIDAYPQWRRIAEDNHTLLQAHAPRFAAAPWYPVSARLAELALTAGPDTRNALADASRIPGLQHALVELAGRGHQLQLANVLRAARGELARLHTLATAKLHATTADPAHQARLRAQRAALADRRRSQTRQWTLLLNAEIQRARVETVGTLRGHITDIQHQITTSIDTMRGDQLTHLPDHLDLHLQATAATLSEHLEHTFTQVTDTVLTSACEPGERDTVLGKVNATLRHAVTATPPRDGSGDNLLIALSAGGIAFMAGRGAAAGLSVLGAAAGGLLIPAAGLGLGLAAGGYVLYRRRVHTDRQHARTWLRDVLTEARAALTDEITVRFTDLQYALSLALDDAAGRRLRDLDTQIAEIDAAAAEDTAGRAKRRAAAQHELDTVRTRLHQADEALLRARALTPAPLDEGQS